MYRRRSKRRQRILFVLTYTLVPLLIVGLVVVLVMMIQGYRFSPRSSSVFQAGLVQFGTTPNGATVTVDGATLGAKTRTRINVSSGTRTIGMERASYVPWQKTVNVVPGSVLWLTYARLIPEDVRAEKLYTYEEIAATIVNRNESLFGVQPTRSEPTFVTIPATNDTPQRSTASLPESLYTTRKNQTFSPVEWGESGRYVLYRQDAGDVREWFVLDRENPDESINLTEAMNLRITSAFFDKSDDRYVYFRVGGTLYRYDQESQQATRALIKNVWKLTQSNDGDVVAVTRSEGGATALSYVTHAANSARAIELAGMDTVRSATTVKYDRRDYVSVLDRTTLAIVQTDLGSSDSTEPLKLKAARTLTIPKTIVTAQSPPNGRFIVLSGGDSVYTFDLELTKLAQVTLKDSKAPLRWLDGYHLLDRSEGQLMSVEFDGANRTPITAVASDYDSVLTGNGRYLYTLQQDEDGYHVVRARIIL